jgi:hypothetical protein
MKDNLVLLLLLPELVLGGEMFEFSPSLGFVAPAYLAAKTKRVELLYLGIDLVVPHFGPSNVFDLAVFPRE